MFLQVLSSAESERLSNFRDHIFNYARFQGFEEKKNELNLRIRYWKCSDTRNFIDREKSSNSMTEVFMYHNSVAHGYADRDEI